MRPGTGIAALGGALLMLSVVCGAGLSCRNGEVSEQSATSPTPSPSATWPPVRERLPYPGWLTPFPTTSPEHEAAYDCLSSEWVESGLTPLPTLSVECKEAVSHLGTANVADRAESCLIYLRSADFSGRMSRGTLDCLEMGRGSDAVFACVNFRVTGDDVLRGKCQEFLDYLLSLVPPVTPVPPGLDVPPFSNAAFGLSPEASPGDLARGCLNYLLLLGPGGSVAGSLESCTDTGGDYVELRACFDYEVAWNAFRNLDERYAEVLLCRKHLEFPQSLLPAAPTGGLP